MEKLWTGVTAGKTDPLADAFNASIGFDSRLYRQDIRGSMAHAAMLGARGIITKAEQEALLAGLEGILRDMDSGALSADARCEDIHMFVEQELTRRIGEAGKKLHTARSRNDQVALDLRLYLREEGAALRALIRELALALTDRAEEHKRSVMPGYTHLQRAQPVSLGHYLLAYVMMLLRDLERLADWEKRLELSPIGSCALAGTSYDTDRRLEAELLGFKGLCRNSMDAVSDRDFCLELLGDLSILMMHLSRLSEELILWTSWEFGFIKLSDAYTTGSSIMPQKRNADMAELVRGKTGRVYGSLLALLTTLKGLPLAYNKDMQEDKEGLFDACDTVKQCLAIYIPMIQSMRVDTARMAQAAARGFINATDLADYLVGKGLAFRDAYRLSGELVALCMERGTTLEELPLALYRERCELIDEEVYRVLDLQGCMERRSSEGGTSPASVTAQIQYVREVLAHD